ncbi:hypothetical protein BJF85_11950 [Saccharomonospora sp. CUA-673]|nr:hypothetical protein [Saccharomonospora sp. CUA-673]OLT48527.1 hypothetical protein BJF85_11950 [Saccharomonospora sp. CUA-673]
MAAGVGDAECGGRGQVQGHGGGGVGCGDAEGAAEEQVGGDVGAELVHGAGAVGAAECAGE